MQNLVENCIFCQIVSGAIPTNLVYQDDQVTVFNDRHPAAPVHLLIIPNRHIISLNRIGEEDEALLGHMIIIARKMAEQQMVSQTGYRLMFNTGQDAGQTVFHLHLHLLGGKALPGFTR